MSDPFRSTQIKTKRFELRLTQTELALCLGLGKRGATGIQILETGECEVPDELRPKLIDILGLSPDGLTGYETVYFVRCHDFIKIGVCTFANSRNQRLSELQGGNPYELKMLGVLLYQERSEAEKRERQLHTDFRHFRYRGEWFSATPKLLDYIEEYTVPRDILLRLHKHQS